ncbi:hypothetical protein [Paenibacillus macerans]|uniref:hypothetical protein n=1 Tax=Paenibacillus macerans TaxID=44252 RepID=UPI003D31FC70
MILAVIGTGYAGLVSGVCFSDLGNSVYSVDKNKSNIEMLLHGKVPIHEPGLEELISKNRSEGRLAFTSNISVPVQDAEIVVITADTSQAFGEPQLQYIEQVAREIALAMNGYKIIVIKSAVSVGINERIKQIISGLTENPFDVVMMPEFLEKGSAVQDMLNPERIIIGTDSQEAAATIMKLHSPITNNIIVTDIRSAEMIHEPLSIKP